MESVMSYVMPLMAGCLVTVATLFVKRATGEGAGITRILFLVNWLFFGVLLVFNGLWGEGVMDWSVWGWIVVGALGMFLGGVFILVSIRSGDVTVQAPLMGTKVVFVGVMALMISSEEMGVSVWVGALMTFLGIMVLGAKDLFKRGHSMRSVLFALMSCGCFGATDVVVAEWAPVFGRWSFITYMVGLAAVMGFGLVPFFRKSLWDIRRRTWLWVWLGAGVMAVQHGLLLYALSEYGKPTAVNILYGSRGLWSIVLVWFVGHWFGNEERAKVGVGGMVRRMVGALLIFGAIVIVVVS